MEEQQENKKQSKNKIWTFIKFLFLSLFPGLKIIGMNGKLKKANKFVNDPWFSKQIWRNRIVSLILALPLLLSMAMSFKIMNGDSNIKNGIERSLTLVKKGNVSSAISTISNTINIPDTNRRIHLSFYLLVFGSSISSIIGWIVIIFHPILTETKKFIKDLKSNGIIKDKHPLVIATPVGYLVKITGNATAKSIMDTDHIWVNQNVRVNDYKEDPKNRAIIFYNKAYKLNDIYDYSGASS